ncbi:MFS transporter, partial [Acinetobacter baumannii]
RMLFGAAAANVGVAQAYISDNSSEADRAKAMGVLGMAFGTGFIIGPPVGALLLKLTHGSPAGIGLFSTVFGLVNVFFVTFFLPEAPREAQETGAKR